MPMAVSSAEPLPQSMHNSSFLCCMVKGCHYEMSHIHISHLYLYLVLQKRCPFPNDCPTELLCAPEFRPFLSSLSSVGICYPVIYRALARSRLPRIFTKNTDLTCGARSYIPSIFNGALPHKITKSCYMQVLYTVHAATTNIPCSAGNPYPAQCCTGYHTQSAAGGWT